MKGDVLIEGAKVSETPLYEIAPLVGSVFQNPRSQFFAVDTDSELAFGCENLGLPEPEIIERMVQIVSDFQIEPLMGRSIFALSGGEKQKIACASAALFDEAGRSCSLYKRNTQSWRTNATRRSIISCCHREEPMTGRT